MSDAIQTGMTAEEILNSPVFKRALESVDKSILASIKATNIDGAPETDRYLIKLYACLKVSDMVKQQIKAAMVTGMVEAEKFNRKTVLNRSGM